MVIDTDPGLDVRARQSLGLSGSAVYDLVVRTLDARSAAVDTFVDVGCGTGKLGQLLGPRVNRYICVDAVRYDDLPHDVEFYPVDLNLGSVPLPDGSVDVVAAAEVIEHLENPRAFVRELVRLAKPGGLVIVTTPNQVSWLSKLTLLLKGNFNAFQDASYPAHITALLPIDLRRIAAECGLFDVSIAYTGSGRIPGTSWHHPRWLSGLFARALSDNVLMVGRKASRSAVQPEVTSTVNGLSR